MPSDTFCEFKTPHCLLLNIGLGVRVRGLLGRVELT